MDESCYKKALIFDCDNTLWEGVIGEDIIKPDWQLRDSIITLARRGVIIGICSKNNEEDVIPVLQRSLLLWDLYIAVYRINWENKVSNLKEIAQELNISLDSIVMVDDSEVERDMINKYLPEVLTVHPKNVMNTVLYWFNLSGSLLKTQEYKQNKEREKFKEQFTDIDDYLRSLDMTLKISLNDRSQINRISELTQKTNQFNLTTSRYSEEEVDKLMSTSSVYSLSVKDKFGDNGIVGVCIIDVQNKETARITSFLLSCRVLGRKIEFAFLDFILKDLSNTFYNVFGYYFQTKKNRQVSDFYSKMGFELLQVDNELSVFDLKFGEYKSNIIDCFKYE